MVASTDYSVFQERNTRTLQLLNSIGEHENLYRIYPHNELCDNDIVGRCITYRDGVILYSDNNHFSNLASQFVVDQIIDIVISK